MLCTKRVRKIVCTFERRLRGAERQQQHAVCAEPLRVGEELGVQTDLLRQLQAAGAQVRGLEVGDLPVVCAPHRVHVARLFLPLFFLLLSGEKENIYVRRYNKQEKKNPLSNVCTSSFPFCSP